jgi:hypothetical protein
VPASRVLIVLDCCHAGGIGQPRASGASPTGALEGASFTPGLDDRFQQVLASGRGRVVLSSSRVDEYSWVEPGARHGLFTEHLVRGLAGAAAGEDGFVRVFDLFEYVQPMVTATRPSQHPVFKGDLETNFAVTQGSHPPSVPSSEDPTYRYDAYLSFAAADEDWVRTDLLPRLEDAGVSVAISRDVEELGVARVVSVERGLRQAKRTFVVLSEAYLDDTMLEFENTLAQTMGISDGRYRLVPVVIGDLSSRRLPERLSMLAALDLHRSRQPDRDHARLVAALKGPVPMM